MSDTSRPYRTHNLLVTNLLLGISALYFLVPIWWLVVTVTREPGRTFSGNGLWFDGFGLFENIALVFAEKDGIFGVWLLNSVLYALVAGAVGTLLSALAGFALAKYRFSGREVVFGVILTAVLIPKVLFTLPLFLMFNALGMLDGPLNPLTFLLPSIVSPFGVYLARVFAAQSVPDEVIEAARLDGAGEFKIFFRMSMPMMSPALVTIFLFQFVEVWNNFLLPSQLITNRWFQTVSVGLVTWSDSNGQVPAGTVITAAFISTIPLVVAFLCLQRFWRAGLTAGAVK
ncbi:multiple sugar transport system permease protein [Pseudoclavibacter chungangensis]|uniref:carbohydrate ABC transporter permease n=1 Tax=Pseudoclavibacter chungangensis TaxID=587635 RepID=UPI001837AA2E|nr:carbohydrate ABC transporter permease [Pseudoclavibacter chungangensis]NYJ68173.1 multiple sugar transport system permease protein [Pseudoclavibacter chungangensis]